MRAFFYTCVGVCIFLFSSQFIISKISSQDSPNQPIQNRKNPHLYATKDDKFIRRIYKVDIPTFSKAYNATLVDDGAGYLMAFRYDEYSLPIKPPIRWSEFYQNIGFVRLNSQFEPIGNWISCKKIGNRAYDPRLFRVKDHLFLTYTSPKPEATDSVTSAVIYLTEVHDHKNDVTVDDPLLLKTPFPSQNYEKNWVPFNYHDEPALSYIVNPHAVLVPSLTDGTCKLASLSKEIPNLGWDWGSIRGGTPAVLVDGEYLGVFHSCKQDPISGYKIYYMGAYTFNSNPPFNLTRVSAQPILHRDFYSSLPNHILTGHIASYVLFPAGIVARNHQIYVCYGENDVAIKVMELDKKKLYESMITLSGKS